MKRVIFSTAGPSSPPPPWSGSLAKTPTGKPSSRANPRRAGAELAADLEERVAVDDQPTTPARRSRVAFRGTIDSNASSRRAGSSLGYARGDLPDVRRQVREEAADLRGTRRPRSRPRCPTTPLPRVDVGAAELFLRHRLADAALDDGGPRRRAGSSPSP
jgi:hypothetical protein